MLLSNLATNCLSRICLHGDLFTTHCLAMGVRVTILSHVRGYMPQYATIFFFFSFFSVLPFPPSFTLSLMIWCTLYANNYEPTNQPQPITPEYMESLIIPFIFIIYIKLLPRI
jgi:hypothetical protein